MIQFRHQLTGIIGTLLLTWAQFSYAQTDESEIWVRPEVINVDVNTALRPIEIDTAYIAKNTFDDAEDRVDHFSRGRYVSTQLRNGYELFYPANGQFNRELGRLAYEERRALLDRQFSPLVEHLGDNEAQPITIELFDLDRLGLQTGGVEAGARSSIKAKKKGKTIIVQNRDRQ